MFIQLQHCCRTYTETSSGKIEPVTFCSFVQYIFVQYYLYNCKVPTEKIIVTNFTGVCTRLTVEIIKKIQPTVNSVYFSTVTAQEKRFSTQISTNTPVGCIKKIHSTGYLHSFNTVLSQTCFHQLCLTYKKYVKRFPTSSDMPPSMFGHILYWYTIFLEIFIFFQIFFCTVGSWFCWYL